MLLPDGYAFLLGQDVYDLYESFAGPDHRGPDPAGPHVINGAFNSVQLASSN